MCEESRGLYVTIFGMPINIILFKTQGVKEKDKDVTIPKQPRVHIGVLHCYESRKGAISG